MDMKTIVSYVPHGINSDMYRPIVSGDPHYAEFTQFSTEFKVNNDINFIVFWNNRNIRRKQPGDVILAFRMFCNMLTAAEQKKCALLMHTDIIDDNGTDLIAVKEAIAPDLKVIFSNEKVAPMYLNFYCNLADVCINLASNEGFGLTTAEAIMAGTPAVVNVTGGLQDQCRFDDKGKWISFTPKFSSNHTGKFKKHGEWVKPIFPSNRSLQGSPYTPYIFDDRCQPEEVAEAIYYWYRLKPSTRKAKGLKGREWMMSRESGMSANEMCRRLKESINYCIDNRQPRPKFELIKVADKLKITDNHLGVVW